MMIPYSEIQYHLKKQVQAAIRPANAKELFNLQHAQLCNIIERIFGIFKKQFPIFDKSLKYLFSMQVKLVYALAGLHDFILCHPHIPDADDENDFRDIYELGDPFHVSNVSYPTPANHTSSSTSRFMNRKRDEIVTVMWVNYQRYISEHYKN